MNSKISMLTLALVFALASTSHAIDVQDKGSMADPEMKAMMEKFAEYSTPGDNHQTLNALIGKWTSKVTSWKSSDGLPEVSEGTSEAKWIMDGRFVQQTFNGEYMGTPFKGMGIIGYDNLAKQYNTIWFDNMGTGMMKGTATFDGAAKTISDKGSFSCPLMGGVRDYRSVTTLIDDNNYTYETYMNDEEGNEFRAMLITYERAGTDEIAGATE